MIECKNEDKINIIKELWTQGMGNRKISKQLNIPRSTLRYLCKKYNLENHSVSNSIEISDDDKSLLTGIILGDTYISNKYFSSYINFAHCLEQEEYFYHKVGILEKFGSVQCKKLSNVDKRSGKIYHKCSYTSKSFIELREFRKIFYPDGIKIIPIYYLKEYFNEKSLAYMYMDDGNFSKYSTTIATCNFERDNIKEFTKFLKDKFNLNFNVVGNKSIRIRQKDRDRFFNIIREYVEPIKCMKYKII